MRLGWLAYVGLCLTLAACDSGSKKKIGCRDVGCPAGAACNMAGVCVLEDAAAPDAGPDAANAEGGAPDATPDASLPDAAPDADLPDAAPDADAPDASEGNLAILIAGNGTVAVSGASACLESPCQYAASPGTTVELEAKPAPDSRFAGWSGDCSGSTANTTVTVTLAQQCVATFVVQRAVSLAVGSTGGGSVSSEPDLSCGPDGCSGEVDDHSAVTLTAITDAGFRFIGWSGSPQCDGATQASLPIDVTQDLACTAQFAHLYTVSVSAAGASAAVSVNSGACTAASCSADSGSSASFSAGPLTGFRFAGWSGDSVCTGSNSPLLVAHVSADIACVANYVARFNATGLVGGGLAGSVVASAPNVSALCTGNSCSVDTGTSATLVAPTVAGYRLTGWTGAGCNASGQSGNGIAVTPTTGDITCTANYSLGVSVTGAVVGAAGSVSATSTSPGASCTSGSCVIDAGGSVALSAPNLLPGFRFKGWSGDAGCAGTSLALTVSNVASSKSCTANYVQEFIVAGLASTGGTVSASAGGVACAGNSCTVDAGTSALLTASADTANGFHFTGWSGASCTPAANNPLTLSNVNATCTAGFALDTFTIAATAGTNGSVTATRTDTGALCAGSSCNVNFGTTVSLVATPALHFHFLNWTGAGCAPTTSPTLSLKNINASCSAAFASDTFSATVAASPVAGGAVGITCPANNCAAVPFGQLVNVSAISNPGWIFLGWSANCNGGVASPNGVTVNANTACVATFLQQFVIAGLASAGGTVSATVGGVACAGNSCTVNAGTSVVLTASADTANGFHFTGWSGANCTPAANNPLTLSNVNATCTAGFALNTFTIAATAGANGSVTATRTDTSALCAGNSCTVNFGTTVSLVATPALHFHFLNWTGAGCTPTTSATLSLQNTNASCSAAFTSDTFTASVSASPVAGGAVAITCPANNCAAVPFGQVVNVSATANPGWSFASWSANCNGGTASPNAVTISANTACVASFRPTVVASVSPAGAGTIAGSGTPNASCVNGSPANCTVDSGGSITLVATAANDAVFTGWSGDCSGTALSFALTAITAPKACTANFFQLWAVTTGLTSVDGMTNVTALADGTVVGFGLSNVLDAAGAQTSRMALVDLDPSTGKLGQNALFADRVGGGAFAALGLGTTQNQKNVIALGVHQFANSQLPWLHNEQAPAWEFEYSYSGGGLATGAGGEVIATTDGGYAFSVGVIDPKLGTMAHLTKVDASGKPVFDTQFCAPGPVGAVGCLPTQPVDLLQDPTAKYFAVLSQVSNGSTELMLTFLDETGKVTGAARYADPRFDLRGAQFAPGASADTFLVVGAVSNPQTGLTDGFYGQFNKAGGAPAFAVSVGADATNEALLSVARTATGYGLCGLFTDAKLLNEAWLVLSTQTGGISSQLAYGGQGADRANAIVSLPAGGFALGGGTNSFGAGANDMWTLRVAGDGALTFNAASGATRQATTFAASPVTLVVTTVASLTQGSAATQSTPAVSSALTGFVQAAQAP